MKIIKNLEDINFDNKTVVTIGTFDALHSGHMLLIDKMKKIAKEHNLISCMISFKNYPKKVLYKDDAILSKRILSRSGKLSLLKKQRIDYLIEFNFNENFIKISAEDFIKDILKKKCNTKYLIVGENFKFGNKASGDCSLLKKHFKQNVFCIKNMLKYNKTISTTRIKKIILKNKIEYANKLLGYNFFIIGKTIEGNKQGRKIGFPTINLKINSNIILPKGVFASLTKINNKKYLSLTHIGHRPTINDNSISVETHIIDKKINCKLGQKIRVELLKKIRKIKKEISLENLKKQIIIDKVNVKNFWRCYL